MVRSCACPTLNQPLTNGYYTKMSSDDDTLVLVVVLMSIHGVIVFIGVIFGIHRQKIEDKMVQFDTIATVDKGTYGDCSKFLRIFDGDEVKTSSFKIIKL